MKNELINNATATLNGLKDILALSGIVPTTSLGINDIPVGSLRSIFQTWLALTELASHVADSWCSCETPDTISKLGDANFHLACRECGSWVQCQAEECKDHATTEGQSFNSVCWTHEKH